MEGGLTYVLDNTRHFALLNRKWYHLTIRPVARKGDGSIAHGAKPNGLLTRDP